QCQDPAAEPERQPAEDREDEEDDADYHGPVAPFHPGRRHEEAYDQPDHDEDQPLVEGAEGAASVADREIEDPTEEVENPRDEQERGPEESKEGCDAAVGRCAHSPG